ncbi:hypothetical protein LX73_0025 [Fodinibius salinus]|uniref:DUF2059 domain-containing protein n=2 Tax=Fodinibius salinus TaxID=860790 RepID=A0A5D3YLM8_9BACT|nr:hypothetical protein LX73_0025 [Fodinibius salinus]
MLSFYINKEIIKPLALSMSTLSRILLFLICFAVLPFTTVGQQSEDSDQTISDILNNIPLQDIAYEVPDKLHQQFQQNPFGLPAAKNKRMMNLFEQAYQKQALYRDAKKAFQKNYNATYADSVIRWMNMEKSEQVLSKRKEFYTLEGQRKQVVNKYELEQTPPAESRKKLIRKLAENTSAANFKIESNIIIFRSLVSAFNTLNQQRTLGSSQIEGIVGNFRNRVKQQIDQQIQNQLLVMYHGIDGNTLASYAKFYQTPSGKWLKDAITKSIHHAYKQAEERFLSSVESI